jgi:hypothetical protein
MAPPLKLSKQELRQKWLYQFNKGDQSPLSNTTPTLIDADIVPQIINFMGEYPSFAQQLFLMSGSIDGLGNGIGKGEVLIYFLVDNVTLGGVSSSIDIHVAGIPYLEVKAISRSGENWVDLWFGTDEFTASHHLLLTIVQTMLKQEQKGNIVVPEHFGNIPKRTLERLRSLSPKSIKTAEKNYFDKLFSGKVGTKKFIIFDVENALPIYYGHLDRSQLKLERFSMGQTKMIFNPHGFEDK